MSKKKTKTVKNPVAKPTNKEETTPSPNELFESVENLGKDLLSGSKSKWLSWVGNLLKYLSNKVK
jgi:hypothetical protein